MTTTTKSTKSTRQQPSQLPQLPPPPPPGKLYADVIFPEAQRQLAAHPLLTGNLRGFFVAHVKKHGKPAAKWYLQFTGSEQAPVITASRIENAHHLPSVHFELEDADLLKLASGGMNGIKALTEGKLTVRGDLTLARQVQSVFERAGGVQRVQSYIQQHYGGGGGTAPNEDNAAPKRKSTTPTTTTTRVPKAKL